MKQTGMVIEVLGEDRVKVRVFRATSCKNCGACGVLSPKTDMEFAVFKPSDLIVMSGDKVLLELKDSQVFKSAIAAFFPPVTGLLFGAVLPGSFSAFETLTQSAQAGVNAFGAASGLLLGLLISRYLDRMIGRNSIPQITEVCEAAVPERCADKACDPMEVK